MTLSRQGLRFLLAGAWNTAFGYAAYLACDAAARALGLHYVVALFPAQLIAVANAYLVHRRFVFTDGPTDLASFLRYNVVYWVVFAVNLVALPLTVEVSGADPRVVQAVFTVVVPIVTFLGHRTFSFGGPGRG